MFCGVLWAKASYQSLDLTMVGPFPLGALYWRHGSVVGCLVARLERGWFAGVSGGGGGGGGSDIYDNIHCFVHPGDVGRALGWVFVVAVMSQITVPFENTCPFIALHSALVLSLSAMVAHGFLEAV